MPERDEESCSTPVDIFILGQMSTCMYTGKGQDAALC